MPGKAQRTAKRVLLGFELAFVRERLSITQKELARRVSEAAGRNVSQAKIAWIEKGESTVTDRLLDKLTGALEITDPDHIAAIREIHRDSGKRTSFSTAYLRGLHEDVRLLADLEQHASLLREAAAEIIPGLLQIEDYIRGLQQRNRTTENTQAVLDARLARQAILSKSDAPVFRLVLSESALRRDYGLGAPVMRQQLDHLLAMSERPKVQIQVLPFNVGSLTPSRFVIVQMPSPGIAGPMDMGYSEEGDEVRYVDEIKVLQARDSKFSNLTASALSVEDTRDFIAWTRRRVFN